MLAHSTTKLRNQKDLELNVIKCCSDISHVSHLIANEPSMALFRVEQHVQKTIPQTTKFSGMTRKSDEMLKVSYFIQRTCLSVDVHRKVFMHYRYKKPKLQVLSVQLTKYYFLGSNI